MLVTVPRSSVIGASGTRAARAARRVTKKKKQVQETVNNCSFDSQLTETGAHGALGIHVARRVQTEHSHELDNAIHPLHSLVEDHAKGTQVKTASAIKMSRVQVGFHLTFSFYNDIRE